jgi:hypothetical protein
MNPDRVSRSAVAMILGVSFTAGVIASNSGVIVKVCARRPACRGDRSRERAWWGRAGSDQGAGTGPDLGEPGFDELLVGGVKFDPG